MNNKGIRDFYDFYVEDCTKKGLKCQPYSIYSMIIKDCNMLIRDKILANEKFQLPYKNGQLSVIKFENSFDPDKQYKWKVDFKKTKELGTKVYYGSPYGYRWKWHRTDAITTGKMYYHFKPMRKASRLIAEAIKNNIEYYEK